MNQNTHSDERFSWLSCWRSATSSSVKLSSLNCCCKTSSLSSRRLTSNWLLALNPAITRSKENRAGLVWMLRALGTWSCRKQHRSLTYKNFFSDACFQILTKHHSKKYSFISQWYIQVKMHSANTQKQFYLMAIHIFYWTTKHTFFPF